MRDMLSLTFATGNSRKRATTSGPTPRARDKILNPAAIVPLLHETLIAGLPLLDRRPSRAGDDDWR
ncbi:hypothetical protein GCM10009416_49540 [Craurococcus roseus]|uniref:Uncharacterized protein n=1 Tax=Craurococcus roseus TaxID=77585 RepID=A0ABN1G8V5_9PROT